MKNAGLFLRAKQKIGDILQLGQPSMRGKGKGRGSHKMADTTQYQSLSPKALDQKIRELEAKCIHMRKTWSLNRRLNYVIRFINCGNSLLQYLNFIATS